MWHDTGESQLKIIVTVIIIMISNITVSSNSTASNLVERGLTLERRNVSKLSVDYNIVIVTQTNLN